jgi:hypothetical protein
MVYMRKYLIYCHIVSSRHEVRSILLRYLWHLILG